MIARPLRRLLAASLVLAPLCLVATTGSSSASELNHHHAIGIRGGKSLSTPPGRATVRQRGNGINYNGGAVMTAAPTNAYVIWYGAWTNTTKTGTISDFFKTVGGSPYFNINTTYTDKTGAKVKNAVQLAGTTFDAYSQGTKNLSDAQILSVVQSAITGGKLPNDVNGVYFVLTSSDVSKSGFLTQYCGWHDHAAIGGADIKYSFVGDPTGPSVANCSAQTASSPNGDVGADAMVSVIAHELEEAVTDPDLNAWFDSRGNENADKCAWTFGTTYHAANGSFANMKLGTRDFLIQRNWLNANGGGCFLAF